MLHRRNIEDVVINDEYLENWKAVNFDEVLYAVESGISPIKFWKGTELQQREKTESVVTWTNSSAMRDIGLKLRPRLTPPHLGLRTAKLTFREFRSTSYRYNQKPKISFSRASGKFRRRLVGRNIVTEIPRLPRPLFIQRNDT
jgi:hypothetical protein